MTLSFGTGISTKESFQSFLKYVLEALGHGREGLYHFYLMAEDPNITYATCKMMMEGYDARIASFREENDF